MSYIGMVTSNRYSEEHTVRSPVDSEEIHVHVIVQVLKQHSLPVHFKQYINSISQ